MAIRTLVWAAVTVVCTAVGAFVSHSIAQRECSREVSEVRILLGNEFNAIRQREAERTAKEHLELLANAQARQTELESKIQEVDARLRTAQQELISAGEARQGKEERALEWVTRSEQLIALAAAYELNRVRRDQIFGIIGAGSAATTLIEFGESPDARSKRLAAENDRQSKFNKELGDLDKERQAIMAQMGELTLWLTANYDAVPTDVRAAARKRFEAVSSGCLGHP